VGAVGIGTVVDQISQYVEVLSVRSALGNSSFVRDFGLPPWRAPLEHYAAYGGISLPTFRDNLSNGTDRLSRNVGKGFPPYA
jgi:hypothetical protein